MRNEFWATGMSYLFMYDCAGDKRDNVLLVPGGYFVDVTMIQLLFHIAFCDRCLTSPWSKLQAERIGDFKKVGHFWSSSNLERYACCSSELSIFVYKKIQETHQQCTAVDITFYWNGFT